jgi:hypothetical protein
MPRSRRNGLRGPSSICPTSNNRSLPFSTVLRRSIHAERTNTRSGSSLSGIYGGERGIRTIASLAITLTYGLLVAIAASLATVAKAPWPILAQRVLGRQMVFRQSGFRPPIRKAPALPLALTGGFVAGSLREGATPQC